MSPGARDNARGAEDLPSDILERLRADFGADAETLLARLAREVPSDLGNGTWARHLRCVIHLAGGDRDRLAGAVELCRTDPRDAILGAEYVQDGPGAWDLRRVRDFDRPFGREADGLPPP